MRFNALTVGELAQQTGLTIRTLHYYDEIGLLKPSLRTDAGYRVYTPSDLSRLQQVLLLRQLGFSLAEVRRCLDHSDFSPLEVIRLYIARLREQGELQQRLCERLEAMATHLAGTGEVSADEFLRTIDVMTVLENYHTSEQKEYLKNRRERAGEDHARQVPAEWAQLIALVRVEMEKGTDPTSPQVQILANRWLNLVNEFAASDHGVKQSLGQGWKEQGEILAGQYGSEHDPRGVFEYIGKAMAAAKSPP